MRTTFEGKKLYSLHQEVLAEFRDGLWISPTGRCLFRIEDDRIANMLGETVFHLRRDPKSGSVNLLDHRKSLVKRIRRDRRVYDARNRTQGVLK